MANGLLFLGVFLCRPEGATSSSAMLKGGARARVWFDSMQVSGRLPFGDQFGSDWTFGHSTLLDKIISILLLMLKQKKSGKKDE